MQTKKLKNIVLVGAFNPMLFDKLFFVKNNIFTEEEIKPDSIIGNLGSRIICERFISIDITPFQFVIYSNSNDPDNKLYKINDIIVSIIKTANINNVSALGFNYNYFFENIESLEETTKQYFYSDNIKLFSKFFNKNDSMFGAYASKNFIDSRLKLNVLPTIDLTNKKNLLHFSFNYHIDIKNINTDNLLEVLKYFEDYHLYFNETERIMGIY